MPDTRGFIVLGLFLLTTLIFAMIGLNPKIAEVQLFGVLATAIISGGLGSAVGYFFGSSKSVPDKSAPDRADPKP